MFALFERNIMFLPSQHWDIVISMLCNLASRGSVSSGVNEYLGVNEYPVYLVGQIVAVLYAPRGVEMVHKWKRSNDQG